MLVNNAGIQRRARFADGPEAADTGEIATNLEAPVRLSALFLPHLLRHAGQGRPAAIINVTSGLGYVSLAATTVNTACAMQYGPDSANGSCSTGVSKLFVRALEESGHLEGAREAEAG